MLFIHFCDAGRLIKRRSMQGINARKVSLPYADPGYLFFFGGGGGGGGLPENNPDNFLVLNFSSLHFTVIERRSRVRACPHSSERLILGDGLLTYFIHIICLFVCFCCFTSHVNSYGHCGTVSSLNHTFSWAGLSKRLTSNLCTYFRL